MVPCYIQSGFRNLPSAQWQPPQENSAREKENSVPKAHKLPPAIYKQTCPSGKLFKDTAQGRAPFHFAIHLLSKASQTITTQLFLESK